MAVIGCGLIGQKRASALRDRAQVVACFDNSPEASLKFAQSFAAKSYSSVEDLLTAEAIDFVLIATPHNSLSSLAIQSLRAGKHVFIEKPGAINFSEFEKIQKLANSQKLRVHIGYNHRFHPAIRKAHQLFLDGAIGEIMFLRGRYGHGGRIGYEKEWRANKLSSGGGELIDQGAHLIDLSMWFMGELSVDYADTPTFFWNMEVEDNAFFALKSNQGNIAFLQASCTEWKNMFSLEIYGRTGKLEISGLGGSYGEETLSYHKMLPEMGPPLTEIWKFPGADESWSSEIEEFINDLQSGANFSDNLKSSSEVLRVIQDIYRVTGR
jgi:predicted dehydrogenase